MKYYIKNAAFAFVYLIVMDVTALLITMIKTPAWQLVLSIIAILFYLFVLFTIFSGEGARALDIRHANDTQRRRMIETGDVFDLKTAEEYKPYKGFIIGVIICVPQILLLIIHLILGLITGGTANGAGGAALIIYYLFYLPFGAMHTGALVFGEYFILLYSVAVISVAIGVAYILGAKKSQRKYDLIERKHREIYGDKN